MKAVVFSSQIYVPLLLYQSCIFFFTSIKAKLSYLSCAAGHADAYWCLLQIIKHLPLQREFIQVSEIQRDCERNCLFVIRLSHQTVVSQHLFRVYINSGSCIVPLVFWGGFLWHVVRAASVGPGFVIMWFVSYKHSAVASADGSVNKFSFVSAVRCRPVCIHSECRWKE